MDLGLYFFDQFSYKKEYYVASEKKEETCLKKIEKALKALIWVE